MTTAATAKIIKLVGSANPPSLVALYGGSLGERKSAMSDPVSYTHLTLPTIYSV